CLAAFGSVALAGCASAARSVVSVFSEDHDPVPGAVVTVPAARATASTDRHGRALVSGLRPGVYKVSVSARGYYATEATVRITPTKAGLVQLSYRPPAGTFIWNIR